MRAGEQRLLDEIALREASLADARRELAAGELSVAAAALIEAREQAALAKARDGLEALLRLEAPAALARRRRRWLLVSGTILVVLALSLWLADSITFRQPGQSITGSISLSPGQRVDQLLNEAEADVANGDVTAALSAYQGVLVIRPENVAALTQVGWLDFSAGSASGSRTLVTTGEGDLRQAIALAPTNPAPRLYYAIVAATTPHNDALARAQFNVFLRLKPSTAQRAIAKPYLRSLGLRS